MRRPVCIPVIAILFAGCSTQQPPPRATPHDPSPAVAVTEPSPAACCTPAPQPCCAPEPARKNQPPDLKLKLGHYSNARRGIGLVFDRSTAQAKLRFDGTADVVKLDRQHGAGDRIDFIRSIGHVVAQQWGDGRLVVYVEGADDGIDVRRDGDADPL